MSHSTPAATVAVMAPQRSSVPTGPEATPPPDIPDTPDAPHVPDAAGAAGVPPVPASALADAPAQSLLTAP